MLVVFHPSSGSPRASVRVVSPDAAAPAVLGEEHIRRAGGTMDRSSATCLYTGLVTDTGRFAFASVTPEVMELGARLLDRHIDHAAINRQVWETHSLGYLKLLGRVCERAAFIPAVGLAWSVVYDRDVTDLEVATGELDSVVDVVRSVACARSTLLVRQLPVGAGAPRWKLSLRSRGGVDVGRAAAALGGGGHAFAAGCTVAGPLDEVVDRVVALLASGADPALVG